MSLYFIGLGLYEKDIPYRGLKIIKKCNSIYLENYTSRLINIESFKKMIGKDIILADREMIEQNPEDGILKDSLKGDVCFLVMGDVFSATTHIDLFLRAKKKNIDVKVIHGASVITAVGVTGLSLYNFGKITSIPFENSDIKAPIDVINKNLSLGMHTLVLLDLNPSENKFMNIKQALEYLLKNGLEDRLCVGCGALGSLDVEIKSGKASELMKKDFVKFPQCLVVCGELHFKEKEALELWK